MIDYRQYCKTHNIVMDFSNFPTKNKQKNKIKTTLYIVHKQIIIIHQPIKF